jgi:hypothetical protein
MVSAVDTLIFGLLLAVALVVILVRTRWIVLTMFFVGFLAVGLLFAYHVTSVLDLSF